MGCADTTLYVYTSVLSTGVSATSGATYVVQQSAESVGIPRRALTIGRGVTYTLSLTSPWITASTGSFIQYPLKFSKTKGGEWSGGDEYTDLIVNNSEGTIPGQDVVIKLGTDSPDTLYYYSDAAKNMGGTIVIDDSCSITIGDDGNEDIEVTKITKRSAEKKEKKVKFIINNQVVDELVLYVGKMYTFFVNNATNKTFRIVDINTGNTLQAIDGININNIKNGVVQFAPTKTGVLEITDGPKLNVKPLPALDEKGQIKSTIHSLTGDAPVEDLVACPISREIWYNVVMLDIDEFPALSTLSAINAIDPRGNVFGDLATALSTAPVTSTNLTGAISGTLAESTFRDTVPSNNMARVLSGSFDTILLDATTTLIGTVTGSISDTYSLTGLTIDIGALSGTTELTNTLISNTISSGTLSSTTLTSTNALSSLINHNVGGIISTNQLSSITAIGNINHLIDVASGLSAVISGTFTAIPSAVSAVAVDSGLFTLSSIAITGGTVSGTSSPTQTLVSSVITGGTLSSGTLTSVASLSTFSNHAVSGIIDHGDIANLSAYGTITKSTTSNLFTGVIAVPGTLNANSFTGTLTTNAGSIESGQSIYSLTNITSSIQGTLSGVTEMEGITVSNSVTGSTLSSTTTAWMLTSRSLSDHFVEGVIDTDGALGVVVAGNLTTSNNTTFTYTITNINPLISADINSYTLDVISPSGTTTGTITGPTGTEVVFETIAGGALMHGISSYMKRIDSVLDNNLILGSIDTLRIDGKPASGYISNTAATTITNLTGTLSGILANLEFTSEAINLSGNAAGFFIDDPGSYLTSQISVTSLPLTSGVITGSLSGETIVETITSGTLSAYTGGSNIYHYDGLTGRPVRGLVSTSRTTSASDLIVNVPVSGYIDKPAVACTMTLPATSTDLFGSFTTTTFKRSVDVLSGSVLSGTLATVGTTAILSGSIEIDDTDTDNSISTIASTGVGTYSFSLSESAGSHGGSLSTLSALSATAGFAASANYGPVFAHGIVNSLQITTETGDFSANDLIQASVSGYLQAVGTSFTFTVTSGSVFAGLDNLQDLGLNASVGGTATFEDDTLIPTSNINESLTGIGLSSSSLNWKLSSEGLTSHYVAGIGASDDITTPFGIYGYINATGGSSTFTGVISSTDPAELDWTALTVSTSGCLFTAVITGVGSAPWIVDVKPLTSVPVTGGLLKGSVSGFSAHSIITGGTLSSTTLQNVATAQDLTSIPITGVVQCSPTTNTGTTITLTSVDVTGTLTKTGSGYTSIITDTSDEPWVVGTKNFTGALTAIAPTVFQANYSGLYNVSKSLPITGGSVTGTNFNFPITGGSVRTSLTTAAETSTVSLFNAQTTPLSVLSSLPVTGIVALSGKGDVAVGGHLTTALSNQPVTLTNLSGIEAGNLEVVTIASTVTGISGNVTSNFNTIQFPLTTTVLTGAMNSGIAANLTVQGTSLSTASGTIDGHTFTVFGSGTGAYYSLTGISGLNASIVDTISGQSVSNQLTGGVFNSTLSTQVLTSIDLTSHPITGYMYQAGNTAQVLVQGYTDILSGALTGSALTSVGAISMNLGAYALSSITLSQLSSNSTTLAGIVSAETINISVTGGTVSSTAPGYMLTGESLTALYVQGHVFEYNTNQAISVSGYTDVLSTGVVSSGAITGTGGIATQMPIFALSTLPVTGGTLSGYISGESVNLSITGGSLSSTTLPYIIRTGELSSHVVAGYVITKELSSYSFSATITKPASTYPITNGYVSHLEYTGTTENYTLPSILWDVSVYQLSSISVTGGTLSGSQHPTITSYPYYRSDVTEILTGGSVSSTTLSYILTTDSVTSTTISSLTGTCNNGLSANVFSDLTASCSGVFIDSELAGFEDDTVIDLELITLDFGVVNISGTDLSAVHIGSGMLSSASLSTLSASQAGISGHFVRGVISTTDLLSGNLFYTDVAGSLTVTGASSSALVSDLTWTCDLTSISSSISIPSQLSLTAIPVTGGVLKAPIDGELRHTGTLSTGLLSSTTLTYHNLASGLSSHYVEGIIENRNVSGSLDIIANSATYTCDLTSVDGTIDIPGHVFKGAVSSDEVIVTVVGTLTSDNSTQTGTISDTSDTVWNIPTLVPTTNFTGILTSVDTITLSTIQIFEFEDRSKAIYREYIPLNNTFNQSVSPLSAQSMALSTIYLPMSTAGTMAGVLTADNSFEVGLLDLRTTPLCSGTLTGENGEISFTGTITAGEIHSLSLTSVETSAALTSLAVTGHVGLSGYPLVYLTGTYDKVSGTNAFSGVLSTNNISFETVSTVPAGTYYTHASSTGFLTAGEDRNVLSLTDIYTNGQLIINIVEPDGGKMYVIPEFTDGILPKNKVLLTLDEGETATFNLSGMDVEELYCIGHIGIVEHRCNLIVNPGTVFYPPFVGSASDVTITQNVIGIEDDNMHNIKYQWYKNTSGAPISSAILIDGADAEALYLTESFTEASSFYCDIISTVNRSRGPVVTVIPVIPSLSSSLASTGLTELSSIIAYDPESKWPLVVTDSPLLTRYAAN